ncbi:MAG: porin family protein [Bacteroides sp.]
MKKIISGLLVAVCLSMAIPAQAQIKFGVKGGVNLSKVSFSKADFKGDNKTGFFIGPMAEFTVPIVGIGLDAAALYSQTEVQNNRYDKSSTMKTMEVPVNLKWSLGLGSMLGVYVAAGPQFGFRLGKEHHSFYHFKKQTTSFNVGAGVKLLRHLQMGVNYNFALSNTGEFIGSKDKEFYKMKNNAWQVSAAYLF